VQLPADLRNATAVLQVSHGDAAPPTNVYVLAMSHVSKKSCDQVGKQQPQAACPMPQFPSDVASSRPMDVHPTAMTSSCPPAAVSSLLVPYPC
jgi:hypothetical protein